MKHESIKSSMISSAGHEGEILEIEFRSGKRYQYSGVSKEMFRNLVESGSPGRFFNDNIKGKFGQ